MVPRPLVGEPHHVVATIINCGVMIILGYQPQSSEDQSYKQCCFHFDSSSLEGGRINVSSRRAGWPSGVMLSRLSHWPTIFCIWPEARVDRLSGGRVRPTFGEPTPEPVCTEYLHDHARPR